MYFRTVLSRFRNSFYSPLIAVTLLSVLMYGCSKEKMDELVQSTKDKISETTKSVTDKASSVTESVAAGAGLSGSITLSVDRPVSTNACYATFIEQQGRPNVLNLQSYTSKESESYPSALIHANVGDVTQTQLSGKTVKAQVFLQNEQSGPIWFTNAQEPVEITIETLQDKKLTARIVSGKIYNSQTGMSVDLGGQLEGVFQ